MVSQSVRPLKSHAHADDVQTKAMVHTSRAGVSEMPGWHREQLPWRRWPRWRSCWCAGCHHHSGLPAPAPRRQSAVLHPALQPRRAPPARFQPPVTKEATSTVSQLVTQSVSQEHTANLLQMIFKEHLIGTGIVYCPWCIAQQFEWKLPTEFAKPMATVHLDTTRWLLCSLHRIDRIDNILWAERHVRAHRHGSYRHQRILVTDQP
jgi:hypothetical protein